MKKQMMLKKSAEVVIVEDVVYYYNFDWEVWEVGFAVKSRWRFQAETNGVCCFSLDAYYYYYYSWSAEFSLRNLEELLELVLTRCSGHHRPY